MAGLSLDHPCVFTVGVLGNVISFIVYLVPLLTFHRVYKKKSTEGFQAVPYVVALFSAMLWMYYALVKTRIDYLLLTINSIGCFIETTYIIVFLVYATKDAKIFTTKLVFLLNVVLFGFILTLTQILSHGPARFRIVGWICVGFSVSVFLAPMSIIKLVLSTKSVEFMPISLSITLTLSAIIWGIYGLLSKDLYIGLPNVLGFILGVAQMVVYLYIICMNSKDDANEHRLPEHVITIPGIVLALGPVVHPIESRSSDEAEGINLGEDEEEKEHGEGI